MDREPHPRIWRDSVGGGMMTKKKPAGEGNPQTGYISTSAVNDKSIRVRAIALIALMAIWGLLPIRTTACLICRLSGGRP